MHSTKVAVLGASGNVGSQIVQHLSENGVTTLAVARNATKIASLSHVIAIKGDVTNIDELASKLTGIDTLISSLHSSTPFADLITLAKRAGTKRLVVVGGAGSLKTKENGPRVLEGLKFPPEYLSYMESAKAHLRGVQYLETVKDFDWLVVSPPMKTSDLPSRGKYRVGSDVLMFNSDNLSQISYSDFALGLVDEVLTPRHHQKLITIAE